MKTIYLIPTLAVALVSLAGTASAQEFDGPSIGVQAGWNKADVRNPRSDIGIAPIDRSRDSFVGGAFVGYDREVASNVVIGVQADFSVAADDKIIQRGATGLATLDPKYNIDLTARAGYVVAPKTLVYVRGGYANQRVRTTITEATGTRSDANSLNGWTVGGGVERILFDKVSARVEYRYADLSDGGGKYDRHQVLVGAAYRF